MNVVGWFRRRRALLSWLFNRVWLVVPIVGLIFSLLDRALFLAFFFGLMAVRDIQRLVRPPATNEADDDLPPYEPVFRTPYDPPRRT